ncbi:hypothetical protein GCM10017767_16780 [Halomonas urumqiensis]|nr:hypothetical protein GCM10017767_16780 [Halomonas urumqiensis]
MMKSVKAMKSNDVLFLILGVSGVWLGSTVFQSPVQESISYGVVDFGKYHEWIGVAIIMFGAISIYSAIRKKK